MTDPSVIVRHFRRDDIPQLLELMRGLARFEGYADAFRVRAQDLEDHGLCKTPAFRVHVAEEEEGGHLPGMAVTYTIPWTYDLRPVLVLKELYISSAYRGRGIGSALMAAVIGEARAIGASKVQWTVLSGNEAAGQFYKQHGGARDSRWDLWSLPLSHGN